MFLKKIVDKSETFPVNIKISEKKVSNSIMHVFSNLLISSFIDLHCSLDTEIKKRRMV
jgi:hypothetical protein